MLRSQRFEGGIENVSLRFDGILKTLPTKKIPEGLLATNFTCQEGPPKKILNFGMVWSDLKSNLKGVVMIKII